MNTDGSDPVRLTDFADGPKDSYAPTWSPDGTQIAFVRGDIPSGGPGELWAMDPDGSNTHLLLADPLADFPSWSPDGTRIAFEAGDFPEVRVAVLDVATGAVNDLGAGFHPIWSPDGSRLAISIPDGSGGFGIVDLAAPNRLQILHPPAGPRRRSPDGGILLNDAGLTASTGTRTVPSVLTAPAPGEAMAGFTGSASCSSSSGSDGTLTAVEPSRHTGLGRERPNLWDSAIALIRRLLGGP
jgi:hypothetical protein